jgi:general secretion pathway protein K
MMIQNKAVDSSSLNTANATIKSERGIALLMVLWVLAILMVIALSFSYMTRAEMSATLSFKKSIKKKFLAEAGIERGIMEIFYRNANKKKDITFESLEVWRTDGAPYNVETDDGNYEVRITDEAGKVDINRTPEVILKNMLVNIGLAMGDADTITDSIMDWKDPDDLHRLHGAESDYYMSLPHPYKAKNTNFETLEELILVRGVSREILYGNEEKRGIIDFLTVNSSMAKININAAPREVLLSIPGMSSDLAEALIASRETKAIQDIQGILGQNLSLMAPYITVADTSTFTIESTGYNSTEETGYTIRGTVKIEGNDLYKYVYYKSPMDVINARNNRQ